MPSQLSYLAFCYVTELFCFLLRLQEYKKDDKHRELSQDRRDI